MTGGIQIKHESSYYHLPLSRIKGQLLQCGLSEDSLYFNKNHLMQTVMVLIIQRIRHGIRKACSHLYNNSWKHVFKCFIIHKEPLERPWIIFFMNLPGMIMLEKPSFLVIDIPWVNMDVYSLLICSMSPCKSWRDTARPIKEQNMVENW